MEIFPCTLVFIDINARASPNSTSKDPLSYARQALCLNKTLLYAGMPPLNVLPTYQMSSSHALPPSPKGGDQWSIA
jgi:hypothetical protein